jgi:uncharacterized protein (DUF885 family)
VRSRSIVLLTGALAVVVSCQRPPSVEDQVRQLSETFVHNSLALSPVEATAAGYHRHPGINLDEQLYSAEGISRAGTFYDHALGAAAKLANSSLPAESQADLDIIRQQCELELLNLNKLQDFRHDPTVYVESLGNAGPGKLWGEVSGDLCDKSHARTDSVRRGTHSGGD